MTAVVTLFPVPDEDPVDLTDAVEAVGTAPWGRSSSNRSAPTTTGRPRGALLARGGRQVMFGSSSGAPSRFDTGDVASRSLVGSSGQWQPLVATHDLAASAVAHAALEGRETLGKAVLRTAPR